jgi:transposase
MDAADPLPTDVPTLQAMVRHLQAENRQLHARVAELEATVAELRAELAALKAKVAKSRFGRSSERTPRPPREKPRSRDDHGRAPLPQHLERRDTIVDLPPTQRCCPNCGGNRIGLDSPPTEQLDCDPVVFFVRRTIRKTYVCPACPPSVPVERRITPAPPTTVGPIPKALCGPGLLADVCVSKFGDHIPLHRKAGMIARSGVRVSTSTLGDWIAQAAILLTPLYRLMHDRVLQAPVIWSDDTRSRFARPGSRTMPHGHFWVTIGDASAPYTTFHFTTGYDAATGPNRFLHEFQGFVHADCLAQYHDVYAAGAKHVACWSHARRKFLNAGPPGDIGFAVIQDLYRVENGLPLPDTPEHVAERFTRRQEHAVPILATFFAWCEATLSTLTPRDPAAIAIRYMTGHHAAFERYVTDGRLSMDNNLSERTLRLIAVGRGNWKFVGSKDAGERAAVLFSITGTCRHLGIDAFAYLRDVLSALHVLGEGPSAESLAELLPDAWAKRQKAVAKAA